jgi:hypothetical protein
MVCKKKVLANRPESAMLQSLVREGAESGTRSSDYEVELLLFYSSVLYGRSEFWWSVVRFFFW